jgi:pyruvate/2-oxoglutarate dehydrogenase complex dihydrolipoamide dehydrogenase (E3) component
MTAVQRRKRIMVEGLHQLHIDREVASGGELIMGNARFVAPRTVEVALNDGRTRTIVGEHVFLATGSRATIPDIPGLAAAQPMTHVEALDLDRVPEHLIVLGGGLRRARTVAGNSAIWLASDSDRGRAAARKPGRS